jgi:hypothetical protein
MTKESIRYLYNRYLLTLDGAVWKLMRMFKMREADAVAFLNEVEL